MVCIIETMFFLFGMSLIVSGNIPTPVAKILIGTDEWKLPEKIVRILGVLSFSPAPVAIIIGKILAAFFGDTYRTLSQIIETAYLLVVIILLILISRRISQIMKREGGKTGRWAREDQLEREICKPFLLMGLTVSLVVAFIGVVNLPLVTQFLFHIERSNADTKMDIVMPYLFSLPMIIMGIIAAILSGRAYEKMNKLPYG